MTKGQNIFELPVFRGHERFDLPGEMERVTSGRGGETIIIFTGEKAVLYDCGMAYCGKKTLENIKKALAAHKKADGSDYTIDYILVSHTHYDHIGALPFVLEQYPDAKVVGSEKGQYIFTRPGALKVIKGLGETARDQYDPGSTMEIPGEGFRIDITLKDGESLDLGSQKLIALETKGHTDCAMAYVFEPMNVMFASESTGVLERGIVNTPILKNYDDSIVSVEKCRAYGAAHIIVPHYGLIPERFNQEYWDTFIKNAKEKRKLVKGWYDEGLSDEEVLEKYTEVYWDDSVAKEQPKEAFIMNAKNIVKVLGA